MPSYKLVSNLSLWSKSMNLQEVLLLNVNSIQVKFQLKNIIQCFGLVCLCTGRVTCNWDKDIRETCIQNKDMVPT